MEFLKKYLTNSFFLFIIIGILFISNVCSVSYFLFFKEKEPQVEDLEVLEIKEESEEVKEEIINKIKVDIKGYVKKPGVYELDEGTIINDLINMAGGLKSGGTTDNINLSKQLKNEDMIVVLSKNELKKTNTVNSNLNTNLNNNISSENSVSTQSESKAEVKKISLNSATKEELMTLSGIGEAKAISIIEYRNLTPFKTIDELMNVSGIGESIYEKIKDFITI